MPLLHKEERKSLRAEVAPNDLWPDLTIAFDGTPRVDEMLGITIRWVAPDLSPQTRAYAIRLYSQSLDATTLGYELLQILEDIPAANIIAFSHDRCSVNMKALENLRQTVKVRSGQAPAFLALPCLAHGLDNLGKKMPIADADTFVSRLLDMRSRSQKGRAVLKRYNVPLVPISQTRWYAKFEQAMVVLDHIEPIENMLKDDVAKADAASANFDNARAILLDQEKWNFTLFQLTMMRDVMQPIASACYQVEGDGEIIFHVTRIMAIVEHRLFGELPPITSYAAMIGGTPSQAVQNAVSDMV